MNEKILILDYGSQYTQLIARRVRESNVYCEIHPYNLSDKEIIKFNPKGIILSGGPQSVCDENARKLNPTVVELGVPVLGICYGMQLLVSYFGGEVLPSQQCEYGLTSVSLSSFNNPFVTFFRLSDNTVWMSHSDHIVKLPTMFEQIATSDKDVIAVIASKDRLFLGVQFHPEVSHTLNGMFLIHDFLFGICKCGGLWTTHNFIENKIMRIRESVGTDQVILGLSGGVDSAVTALLIHKAIGTQLTCIFVDNGLLRMGEGDEVMRTFAENLGVKVIRVDAEERFLSNLKGVADPEQKRKIIGHTFIEVFEEESRKIPDARWLAQGTIYPDVIESEGKIKSHHNTCLPETMQLELLEPLRELFKDEVRQIGLELGLTKHMIFRHPFPGPGLGVRILGEVCKEYADILRQADSIYIEELHSLDYYDKVSQAFAVFLPIKSVGVKGDNRSYEYVISLRAVETQDYMTANHYPLPHDLLSRIANRIINEVKGVNRVAYDITSKPPGTIEWE